MLTTREKIESYLLVSIDDDYVEQVEEFIAAVTAYIERFTGRTFAYDSGAEATAKLYDGNNTDELSIDDAVEVTQVKIGDDILSTTDFVLYPSNRLPKTRIVLPYRYFTAGNQNVTVTAKWGYGEEVPEDLSFAATVMVGAIINAQQSTSNGGDVQSETIGRYSVTYTSGSTQEHDFSKAKDILKMYRRMT